MIRKHRKVIFGVLGLIVTLIVAGVSLVALRNSDSSTYPHEPSPVPITLSDAPSNLKIGVIETMSTDSNEGGGWSEAGQGVLVSAYRLRLGGVDVELRITNDYGTNDGARTAIQDLKQQSVSGIIALTSGAHAHVLAEEAHKAGIPIIFPYESNLPELTGVWSLASEENAGNKWVDRALHNVGGHRPVVIRADGADSWEGEAALELSYSLGQDDTKFVEELLTSFESYSFDSVVILGNPIASARVTALAQAAGVTYPLIVSPACRNPLFASTLANQGLLSADITSVGVPDADIVALESTNQGNQAAAFFTAIRAMNAAKNEMTLEKDRPFSEVAAYADALSHDALIALVRAAAEAKSTNPTHVASALETLTLTSDDSVIHAPLDFSHSHVMDKDSYAVVKGTSDTTGLRGVDSNTLIWFGEEQ